MDEHQESTPEESSVFGPIPKLFHSDLTDTPLEHCVTCDRDLYHGNEPYIIEKAFRFYPEYGIHNTIFEYIMCIPCAQKMHASMSKTSLQRIQDYFSGLDMIERSRRLHQENGKDIEAWLSNCLVKGTPRTGLEEYQICAQCVGDKLAFDTLPYMLSHEASNEIVELLSPATLDEYNRFVDDFFGLPPEFKKALKDSPVLI